MLSHHASSAAPQIVRTAPPVCGAKNLSSVRLYSAPQLHRTIVAIPGICARNSQFSSPELCHKADPEEIRAPNSCVSPARDRPSTTHTASDCHSPALEPPGRGQGELGSFIGHRITGGAGGSRGTSNHCPIYVNTSKQVGHSDHLKVFAHAAAAETWLQENDPERVAFEYEILE
jgi:hypothetical protein